MRLFVGIPSAGSPARAFVDSLSTLELPAGVTAFERGIVTGNFIPAQRDVLLERGIAWKADVVVMCDDDMVLPPNAVRKLCDVLNEDPQAALAGALYYSRDGLRPMAVDAWDEHDTTRGWIPAFDDRTPVQVDGVGFGCVAIRTSAVTPFERPFFSTHVFIERAAGRVRICDEDYLFCARLRAAGHRIYLHPGARCGHYDRNRNATAPTNWEPPEATNVPRVLTQTGETYKLIPIANAPEAPQSHRHIKADVTYIEADA